MTARPAVANTSSNPAGGQPLCNTTIVTGFTTIYCSKSMYHEGHHQSANGYNLGQRASIYNNK